MKVHLERKLRLITDTKHKSLYQWAINELDDLGNSVGEEQIPWPWSVPFIGTSCTIRDGLKLHQPIANNEQNIESIYDRSITVDMIPDSYDRRRERPPIFSMFGTDRQVRKFTLNIHTYSNNKLGDGVYAWGAASSTYELNFSYIKDDDHVGFEMRVGDDAFSRYESAIISGTVDEILFIANGVSGFYAPWSPSIHASKLKILSARSDHPIDENAEILPPRLGDMAGATLTFRRRFNLSPPPE